MNRVAMHIGISIILLVVSGVCGFLLLTFTSPNNALFWQFLALYLLIFAFVCSLASIFGFFARAIIFRRGSRFEFVSVSRRQGILSGVFAVLVLMLQGAGLLSLLTALPLLAIFLLVEFYLA